MNALPFIERSLDRRSGNMALALVADLAQALASSLDLDAALNLALSHIVGVLDAQGGAVFLIDTASNELVCRACAGPVDIHALRIPADRGIVGRAFTTGQCQIVRDAASDPDFTGAIDRITGVRTQSMIGAPLMTAQGPIGVLQVINKRDGEPFDESDRDLLRALAAPAALAASNAALTRSLIEHDRIRRELQLARRMQRSLLPKRRRGGFPVLAINRPAREISGDFYDFFDLPDGRIGFAVGDVAGKGLDAAFLMVRCASLLRFAGKEGLSPSVWLARANDDLCETVAGGTFVCAAVGYYDPRTHMAIWANAGFPPVLVHGRGNSELFRAEGPPLGIVPGMDFPLQQAQLDGRSLYLFSDGVTDARDAQRQFLGVDGVVDLVSRHAQWRPETRLRRIVGELRRRQLGDDTTLLMIEGAA
ncbi:MAG TPA: SpoIIE family protein phosphatase [Pseudomonadota bacterium]|nr:SpoIIE family protein phosphatase [Xanthomonadales bacterium]HQW80311.1 SpoIIE family protein phosphatase [Pseudomonadota bacterium]